ncbi:MAG TPA: SusC/RagA family TonB-linked outer membrane protein, partial [Gemmatirosa sp.]
GAATQYPYGGRPGSMTPDSIQKALGAGTDWQSLIYRNAPITDANLSAQGGDDRGSYTVSGNLLDQQGVVNGSSFRRGGARFNLDRNVTDRFRLSSNFTLTRSINDMVRSSTINGYNAIGIIRDAVTYTPIWNADSAKYGSRVEDPTTLANFGSSPLRYTDEVSENDQVTRGLGGIRGTLTLGKGFSFDENIGANYEARNYGAYFPSTVNEGRTASGDALQSGSLFNNILSESWLRYAGNVSSSQHLDAIAGFTYQNDRSNWNSQEVQGFPNDILGGNVLQNGTVPLTPQTGLSTSQLVSYLARVNYQLLDRYLLTGTIRADGSSVFAQNNKWSAFPAIAFAWRVIEEPFLRRQSVLSDLKVRLSDGKSGNQAINPYQSLAAIGGISNVTLNETTVPAYAVTQLGNPNLKWETTNQFDAGLDIGAFSNRLTGTVDIYRKNTYDLLQQITLAQNTGFGTTWINSGNVTNRGVEFLVGYDVLRNAQKGGLTWNTSFNASHNTNRIMSLGNGVQQQFASRLGAGGNLEATPFIQKVGLPIGAMWGYTNNGVVKNAADSAAYAKLLGSAAHIGDLKYADINGDGKIDANDQHVIGDANPKWQWGWNNTVHYGKFDASALVIGVKGNSIINTERMRYLTMNGTINIPTYYLQNAYNPTTNPNGIFPMVLQSRQADTRFSDIYIEDGSFIRLKNVQLGYTLNLPRARNTRVYVNGINLLTHTRYTGYDPEVSAFGDPTHPGVDLGSYPQQRTFTFGLNTSF